MQVLAFAFVQVLQLRKSSQAVQAVVVPVVVALKCPGLHEVHWSSVKSRQVRQPELQYSHVGTAPLLAGTKYYPSSQLVQTPSPFEVAVAAVQVLQAQFAEQI